MNAEGNAERLAKRVEQLEQEVGLLSIRVLGWRTWAQFVYLGGGTVAPDITDAELQRHVCEAHDREVSDASGIRT